MAQVPEIVEVHISIGHGEVVGDDASEVLLPPRDPIEDWVVQAGLMGRDELELDGLLRIQNHVPDFLKLSERRVACTRGGSAKRDHDDFHLVGFPIRRDGAVEVYAQYSLDHSSLLPPKSGSSVIGETTLTGRLVRDQAHSS